MRHSTHYPFSAFSSIKNVIRRHLTVTIAVISLCSCADKKQEALPEPVKTVADAVIEGNSTSFAAVCDFPIERPYPLRDIRDSKEMAEYYKIMVDDSLRNAVSDSRPSDWNNFGWRGWALKSGEYFWIDDNKIYEFTYMSDKEKKLLDSLASDEISSLPADMREDWTPDICLDEDDHHIIYRIDGRRKDLPASERDYRLCVYKDSRHLRHHPAEKYSGRMTSEGTAGIRTYYFTNEHGDSIIYFPDDNGETSLMTIEIRKKGKEVRKAPVRKVYWRDLLDSDTATSDKVAE